MQIAYIVSKYPAPSLTFIRREVEAVRRQDLRIETFSVRRPGEGELASVDVSEYERTYYVLPVAPVTLVVAHLAALFGRPLAYLGALRFSLSHRVPGLRAFVWALFHFAEAVLVARELRRRRVERVHNHFGNATAVVGLIASRLAGLPWSFTIHGTSELDYPAGPLLGRKIEAAEFVACVSYFGRAQAMQGVESRHWPKLFVSRCGLELGSLPARSVPPDTVRPWRFICVGRLAPEKGHAGLLQAFAKVVKHGLDAELVLVGDGPDREHVESLVAELGLGDRCRLRGWLGERATLQEIADSDALVVSSLMEGLPVVIMEAMALRVPVIAPAVGGIPELVEQRVTGLLYAPSDFEGLAAVMRESVDQAARSLAMADAARVRLQAGFGIDEAVAPLVERLRRPAP